MTFDIRNEKFSGVTNISTHLFMSQIETNIKGFLDWGFLHIGGFINVERPDQNIYGNPLAKLKPTEDPNYISGQVWQTMRKDWVWEKNVSYEQCVYPYIEPTDPTPTPYTPVCTREIETLCPEIYQETIEPILIDGIYIDNVFYPLNSSMYIVDYINSRIIFNTPIDLDADVQMEYSYRWVQVYTYDNAQWWRQLQQQADNNLNHFEQPSEGDFSILSTNRVQLPAIIIETAARSQSSPWELGAKSLVMKQDLLLHIVAETMSDRNKIIDILRLQQDKVLRMYDINTVIKNSVQPFYINGTLNAHRINYGDLIWCDKYYWKTARLIDIYASDSQSFNPFLAEATVRFTAEIIFDIQN